MYLKHHPCRFPDAICMFTVMNTEAWLHSQGAGPGPPVFTCLGATWWRPRFPASTDDLLVKGSRNLYFNKSPRVVLMCTSLQNHYCDLTDTPSHKGHRNSLLMWEISSKPEEPCERQKWSLSRTMCTEQYFSRWVRWMTKFKGIKKAISSSEGARSKQPLGWHPSHIFDYHFLACNFLRFFAFSKTCEADSKTKWQMLLLLLTFFFVKLKGCFTKAGLMYLWTWATVLWCHWGKTQVIW